MPNTPLNSLQLSTFLTVAESGGVLPAARRLNLSQPAVSARIQQLEESLGTTLFLRSPRGMKLTASGNHLLDYARRAAELLTEAANAMQADAAAPAEPLTLAASTTPATYVLPALLARHRAGAAPEAPDPLAGFTLRVGNTEQVLGWVRDGTVPLGLVEGRAKVAGIHLEHFMDDELLPVYAPASLPAEICCRVERLRQPADLANITLLWREEGSGSRRLVEAALDRLDVPASVWSSGAQFGGGTDTIKAGVLAGVGVAFLPRCAITAELEAKTLCVIPLKALRIRRAFRWATCGSALSGPAAAFRKFAQRRAGS